MDEAGLANAQPRPFSLQETNVLAVRLNQFMLDEEGVTSIEYALVGALIAVVCVVAVGMVATGTRDLYESVCNAVTKAVSGAPAC